MNMFSPSSSTTIEEYIQAAPEERQPTLQFLDEFIRKTVPHLEPHFATNMPGYGKFPYTNYKKEEIEWPVIAFAHRKNGVSLYVCAVEDGQYIAEKYADKLGKVNVGKSCIRFKKAEDLDLKILEKVLKSAAETPGFVSTKL